MPPNPLPASAAGDRAQTRVVKGADVPGGVPWQAALVVRDELGNPLPASVFCGGSIRDATAVVPAALERGLIVNRTAERVVRLLPPYVISEAEISEAVSRLDAALSAVQGA